MSPQEPGPPSPKLAPGKKPATILAVDDTAINLTIISRALEADYRVLTASSGEAALRMASEQLPDLILLDVMMPGMDGFATAEALHRNPLLRGIPIVFLTALSDQESQIRGLELGAVDFLPKPINLTILKKRVANVIEREQLRTATIKHETKLRELLIKQTEDSNTLESAFSAIKDALLITDQNFDILRINNNAQTLFGCGPGGLNGASLRRFTFKGTNGKQLLIEELLNLDAPGEYTIETPEDRILTVSIAGRSFRSGAGEMNYLFSLHDISNRLALEKQRLHANKLLHEALLELSTQKEALDEHALVSITDAHGVITYANAKFCATSGYSLNELLGKTHQLLKSDEHSPAFYTDLWRTISSGRTWHGQITNRSKNGDLYWVESTIVPWLNEEGTPYQYVAIRTDISELHRTEQQLALARSRELEIGASIQKRLLFGKPPAHLTGISLACFSEASQGVDGDFYTYTRLNSNCVEILTGDVMGKGVAAALFAAGVINTYHKVFSELLAEHQGARPPSPAEIINAMHTAITPGLIELDSFVTMSLLRVDRQAQTVTWVNAGHTPTLLARDTGLEIIELLGENLPLGVIEEEHYQEWVTPLAVGDTLLVYSDGLSESVSPDNIQFGEERIKGILSLGQQISAPPSITLNSLRSVIHDYTQYTSGGDDRTAVLVQLRPLRDSTRGSIADRRAPEYLDLPRQLEQLGPLRPWIATHAADQSEDFVATLVLAAFEAATNVVRHTPEKLNDAPLTLVLSRNARELVVELVYEGLPFAPTNQASPDFSGKSEGGFGLFIIEKSVDKVEYGAPMPGLASIRLAKQLST